MNSLRKTAAAVVLTAVTAVGLGSAQAADISVRMDYIASDGQTYVQFGDIKPFQVDNRTLVPARDMAEAAGMEVTWDQATQTAILTLTPNAYSDKPIERYAAELISQINGFGLDMQPLNITAALRLYDANAVIRYNFTDSDGDIVAIGKKYEMDSLAALVNDGTLVVPIRHSMEMFGLNVDWNQDEMCAYVSIPDNPKAPDDMAIIANHGEGDYSTPLPAPENYSTLYIPTGGDGAIDTSGMTIGAYIGNFKITHYCPCAICTGGYGGNTAWAGKLIPGQTIAVNPNTIPKLSWVYIDGYGFRRAEDTGGGINAYQIDVAVPVHSLALELGVVYKDVYFAQ